MLQVNFFSLSPSDSISSNPDLDLCTGGWVVILTMVVTAGWTGEEEDEEAAAAETVASGSSSTPGVLTVEV